MNTSIPLAAALSIGLASFAATSQTTTDHSQHTAGAAAPAAHPSADAATEQQVSAHRHSARRNIAPAVQTS